MAGSSAYYALGDGVWETFPAPNGTVAASTWRLAIECGASGAPPITPYP